MAVKFPKWKSVLGAVAVSGVALLAAAPPALAQDGGGGPDPTRAPTQERVSAQTLPGIDKVVTVVGDSYLVNPANGRAFAMPGFTMGCTGFTVSADGYVGTAGHCVDPVHMADQVRIQFAQLAASQGYDANQMYQLSQSWIVAGDSAGQTQAPQATYLKSANANPDEQPMEAQVVDLLPTAKGDTALLKVNGTNMLTVPMGPNDPPATGAAVVAVGYPGAKENSGWDKSMDPSWEPGTVGATQTKDGIPYTEISSTLGHGMSGGPTVNDQGQVIGINASGATDEGNSAQFNFVTPASRLNEMLTRHGVHTAPGPVDAAYRAGLKDYYEGYYSDAQEEFDKALAVSPNNKAVLGFKDKATKAHEQFGDKGLGLMTWGLIGGGAFLVLFAGGATIVMVRRRKGDDGAAPALGSGPVTGAPMGPGGPAAPGTATPFGFPAGYTTAIPGMPQQAPQQQAPQHWAPQQQVPQVHVAQQYVPQQYAPQQVPQQQVHAAQAWLPQRVPAQFGTGPAVEARHVETGPSSPAVGIPAAVGGTAERADAAETIVRERPSGGPEETTVRVAPAAAHHGTPGPERS